MSMHMSELEGSFNLNRLQNSRNYLSGLTKQ